MEEDTKHSLSIVDHSHFILAYLFDILNDLSSVLVRTSRYCLELKSWSCVCVFAVDLSVLLPSLTLVLVLIVSIVLHKSSPLYSLDFIGLTLNQVCGVKF
jgi:hypothetical protein